ncbi:MULTISPECIES: bifunctional hydroxymethylpyrimidine kinase/phosphomethylpyrimidine kinase [unclassified Arthrobacter]|uniref:bifunctional hydroxymethylpyrimidine kinase/phosphomethylpyrimidine kinase n=1 Tax=unclassified Arthrobacter TaxID=235627 RepID=UPI0033909881
MLPDGWPGTGSFTRVTARRVETANTHGTGCSMSSAMATLQVRFGDWTEALTVTKAWLQDSLLHAWELQVGSGAGPIHHFHQLWNPTVPVPGEHPVPGPSPGYRALTVPTLPHQRCTSEGAL